jgi:hypothetical protein
VRPNGKAIVIKFFTRVLSMVKEKFGSIFLVKKRAVSVVINDPNKRAAMYGVTPFV